METVDEGEKKSSRVVTQQALFQMYGHRENNCKKNTYAHKQKYWQGEEQYRGNSTKLNIAFFLFMRGKQSLYPAPQRGDVCVPVS